MQLPTPSSTAIASTLRVAALGLVAVPATSQAILQPAGVTTTMRGFSTSPAISLIDQSGLRANYQSGVTDFESFVTSTSHANSNPASIVTVFVVGGTITLDLGQAQAIDAVHLWGLRTFSTTLTGFSLFADDDGDFANGTSSRMGDFTGAIGQGGTTFRFGRVDTRFVHIEVTANGGSNVVKIGEAAFRAARTSPFVATVPPGDPASGPGNVVPFGAANAASPAANQRYQTLVTPAQLGGAAQAITGLRFVPAGTGSRRFERLVVRMGHTSANSLTNTFDTNLAPGAGTTVLDLRNHIWHNVADTFNDIGLQVPFAFNGNDNVIVEIVTVGAVFGADGSGPTSFAFRRAGLPRLSVQGHDGTQATGSLDSSGQRMQFYFADASTSRFGEGCAGSRGDVPSLSFTGDPVIGQSVAVDLEDGLPSAVAVLVLGLDNRSPGSPLDLGLLGAPGCLLYHDVLLSLSTATDSAGSATLPVALSAGLSPAVKFYCQWLVLDAAANTLGATTSNYGRVAIGL